MWRNHFSTLLPQFQKLKTAFNSGLHPPTRWGPFLAATMLRSPEPTEERVEPTILSIISIEIRPTHVTWFTLLLLLRIQIYMSRNYVATWAYANNRGRNFDLNKIRFSCLHYFLQYNFWIGFASEKLKSL